MFKTEIVSVDTDAARIDRSDAPAAPDVVAASISGIEMSRLSGIGRERLRTWERRHGFPTPVRGTNGTRRYLADDVRRVVAVARLVERGTCLADAIRLVESGIAAPRTVDLGAGLAHAAAPALAVTGPSPLVVSWTNVATSKAPEAPTVGEELTAAVPGFGVAAVSQIQRLMAGDADQTAVIEHTDWIGSFPVTRRSLAWRISAEGCPEAMVVLVQLPDAEATSAAAVERTSGWVWASAVASATGVLRSASGIAAVQRAVGEVVKATGAIDGFIATVSGDMLRTATSVRALFPATTLAVGADAPLLGPLRDDDLRWLDAEARRELDAMPRSATLAIPITAGGNALGLIFLVYPEQLALCALAEQQLNALGLTIGLALQRESLAQRSGAAKRTSSAVR